MPRILANDPRYPVLIYARVRDHPSATTEIECRRSTGDEKHVASAYAVSFGGNAVTAAFCCAKLGIVPDLIATVANDWLGRMFQDMSAK